MKKPRRYDAWRHERWPQKLQQAWLDANFVGDALTPSGRAAILAPRTLENAELALGRYIEFRGNCGLPNDPTNLASIIQLHDLRAYAHHLLETVKPQTVLLALTSLCRALRLIDERLDQSDFRKVIRRFARIAKRSRDIDSRLLSPIQLVEKALEIMDEAEQDPVQGIRSAETFRNGLLILGATLCPLRRENWRIMRIGEHVIIEESMPKFRFESDTMKGRRPFECPIPTEYSYFQRLQRYISHFRPRLLNADQPDPGFLFISRNGGQMGRATISMAVELTLMRRTQKRFSFHMFRYSAATFICEFAPERMHIARDILHHRTLRTTAKHYIKGQQTRAIQMYQNLVAAAVKRAKRRGTKKSKPNGKSRPPKGGA